MAKKLTKEYLERRKVGINAPDRKKLKYQDLFLSITPQPASQSPQYPKNP